MQVSDLGAYGAPAALVEVWADAVRDLTDIQERAVREGALDGDTNLLVVAPTSSGKTFVGEMAATSSAYSRRRHSIFIVPFRALAEEHFHLFRERYGELLSVVISTGDWSEFDADIRDGAFNLAVMTYEKLMGFLVHQPALIARCTALVIDEVQSLADVGRGADLELLLTRVLLEEQSPQVVALSASLDELNDLDRWLQAKLVMSDERPIPLTQAVCDPSGMVSMLGEGGSVIRERLVPCQLDRDQLVLAACQKFVGEGKQVIVFRSTISKVLETARALRGRFPAVGLSQTLGERLSDLDESEGVAELRQCLASRVAFHNADLTYAERRMAEEAFRSGDAKALVSTTTLSMGVNLPSDVVVVADSRRPQFERGRWRQEELRVSEYRNAAGRAGRLGQHTEGFSLFLADNSIEHRQLVDIYLLGHVEPVESQIPRRPFADVVFNILCAELAHDEAGVVNFISSTLAYRTFYERTEGGLTAVREGVRQAVDECLATGLVVVDEGVLRPTEVGKVLAGAGLSLATSVRLAGLLPPMDGKSLSKKDVVFEVASCEEVGDRPWPPRRRDPRPGLAPDASGCGFASRLPTLLARPLLTREEAKSLVRSKCLLEWMAGTDRRVISRAFRDLGAAPARVQTLGKNAAWLLETLAAAARVGGRDPAVIAEVREAALEARYGLPAALAPLARLQVQGISREQLLSVYERDREARLHDPEVILETEPEKFEGVLSTLQVARLKAAIVAEIEESMRRRRAGHVARAEQADLPVRLVDALYAAGGRALEQAVADALTHLGLAAKRLVRQPHGEEDIQLTHESGTVVISVTASDDDARPIKWRKAREVLGTGAGLNPVNYVCMGRPGFESLAEHKASEIARETGPRRLLLVPIPILAEVVVRCSEGRMQVTEVADLLAGAQGVLRGEDLPDNALGDE